MIYSHKSASYYIVAILFGLFMFYYKVTDYGTSDRSFFSVGSVCCSSAFLCIYLSVGRSFACLVIVICNAVAYYIQICWQVSWKQWGLHMGHRYTEGCQAAWIRWIVRLWYAGWLLSGLEKFSRWVATLLWLGIRWQSAKASAVLPDALFKNLWRHCTALISSFNCATKCIQNIALVHVLSLRCGQKNTHAQIVWSKIAVVVT